MLMFQAPNTKEECVVDMLRNRRINKRLNTISRSEAAELGRGEPARITGLGARARAKRRRREKAGLEIEGELIVV